MARHGRDRNVGVRLPELYEAAGGRAKGGELMTIYTPAVHALATLGIFACLAVAFGCALWVLSFRRTP